VPEVFYGLTKAARTVISLTLASLAWFLAVHTDALDTSLLNLQFFVVACPLACEIFVQDKARFAFSAFIYVALTFGTGWITLVTSLILGIIDLSFWLALW
jgi:hypothetical protein